MNFAPDKLMLITEALEQLGYNLLYVNDDVSSRKLEQTFTLYEEINTHLDKCTYG